MNVNKKTAIPAVSAVGFEKFFYGQMQNYLDKLKMIEWNSYVEMNELFSNILLI